MPLFPGLASRLVRNAGDVEWAAHIQKFIGTLVDNGASQASVYPQSEILFDGQDFHGVVFSVGYEFVGKHGGNGIISHVVGNSQTAPK